MKCFVDSGVNPIMASFQILKFMHAQSTYFHQGYDLMTDLDEYMKKVSKEVRKKLSRYAPVSVDPKG